MQEFRVENSINRGRQDKICEPKILKLRILIISSSTLAELDVYLGEKQNQKHTDKGKWVQGWQLVQNLKKR